MPSEPTFSAMLLTRAQAAQALALSIDTVDNLIRDGAIPVIRIGRSVRIAVDDLRTYVSHQRAGAAEASQ